MAIWNKKIDTIDGRATNRKMKMYWGSFTDARHKATTGNYLHPTLNLRSGLSNICTSDNSTYKDCNGVIELGYKKGDFLMIEWAYQTKDPDQSIGLCQVIGTTQYWIGKFITKYRDDVVPFSHWGRFTPESKQIFSSPSSDTTEWTNSLNNGFVTGTNPVDKAQIFKLDFDRPVTFHSYFSVSYTTERSISVSVALDDSLVGPNKAI